MSSNENESCGSTEISRSTEAQRLYENTKGVITSSGLAQKIGIGLFTLEFKSIESIEVIKWTCPEFKFAHAAGLLLLQGLSVQTLFGNQSILSADGIISAGPFILLRGDLNLHHSPLVAKNLVLMRVLKKPDISSDELMSVLLKDALSS